MPTVQARERVSQRILQNGWDIEQLTLVVPNRRLALFSSRDWDYVQAQQQSVWQPLQALPWDQWVAQLWQQAVLQRTLTHQQSKPMRLLAPDQCLELWLRATKRRSLAQQALAADELSRQWQLHITLEDCSYQQAQFLTWQTQYQQFKRDHNWCDPIDAMQFLLAEQVLLPQWRTQQIRLDGFIEFSPLQTQLLEHLRELGMDVVLPVPSQTVLHQGVDALSWSDEIAELTGAAQWALRCVAQANANLGERKLGNDKGIKPFTGPRFCVVVPDLAQRVSQVKAIFDQEFNWQANQSSSWTLSAGRPLLDYPLMTLALDILQLVWLTLPYQQLERLLLAPQWLDGHTPTLVAGICRELRDTGNRFWTLTMLLEHLNSYCQYLQGSSAREDVEQQQGFTQALLACLQGFDGLNSKYQPKPKSQTWSQWLGLSRHLLADALWPGNAYLSSTDFQLLQRWQQWWLAAEQIDPVIEQTQLNAEQFCARLQQSWREAIFQPEASNDQVLVLGVLEGAGLAFDAVLITGMTAQYWPPRSAPNPFIPYHLQRKAQLPRATTARELFYGRELLKCYANNSRQISLSYGLAQQDIKQFASPLVRDVFGQVQWQIGQPQAWQARFTLQWQQILQDDLSGPDRPLRAGVYGLSWQARCPFAGTLLHRLGVSVQAPARISIDASQRGQWLHQALQRIWQSLGNQDKLKALSIQERQLLSMTTVQQVLKRAQRRYAHLLTPITFVVECERLTHLVAKSLELDAERAWFEVLATEQSIGLQLKPAAEAEQDLPPNPCKARAELPDLELNLQIDRLDRLEDGRFRLIDYKSSKPMQSDIRLIDPQLILYVQGLAQFHALDAINLAAQLEAAGYGIHHSAKGVFFEDMTQGDPKSWLPKQTQLLDQLCHEIMHGNSELRPFQQARTCQACDFRQVCTISRRQL